MIHEPEPPRATSKRKERIIVVSLVVCAVSWIIGASFGFAGAVTMGGNAQYRLISEVFFWIWIISMIPIAFVILSGALDRLSSI